MSVISLDEAVDHLRLGSAVPDLADVQRKADEATDIALAFVTDTAKATWNQETCPPKVKAAVKLILANLYDGVDEPFSLSAQNLLWPHRTPTLA